VAAAGNNPNNCSFSSQQAAGTSGFGFGIGTSGSYMFGIRDPVKTLPV